MKQLSLTTLFSLLLLAIACSPAQIFSGKADPLQKILKSLERDSVGIKVLQNKDLYEVQIIYTQIDRDAQGCPSFRTYQYNVDSSHYFYPASMVKMPLALLSLEKINQLGQKGALPITKDTPYRLDSLRPYQQAFVSDPNTPCLKPGIAQDIRQIFTVSDNLAYNHCFEFLGREYINKTLKAKGYNQTGIVHRFNYPGRDNRYASPITFFDPKVGVYQESEKFDTSTWINPQYSTLKGKGYYNAADSLVNQPFEMNKKNWFALTDMNKMLRAVMFPESVPAQNRFDLSEEDYRFLWHYMGIFPRECDYPKYDTSYTDGYVKFFLFGDSKAQQNGSVRVFNKVGEAYGTLTDVAYIVDFEHKVEFMLAATILCNSDGIFNDDHYDYENVGFPFLAKLGRAALELEKRRKRSGKVDLGKFRAVLTY
jgi:Beta-lactamase enzyme family